MDIITKKDIDAKGTDLIKKRIINGEVFIYPTDTIYGIGCNALNKQSISKIREIKRRDTKPFSVIAPNKDWIHLNCKITDSANEWIDKLPGPYTLILKLKDTKGNAVIPVEVNDGMETLGVRMPNHWITDLASKIGIPIITTSVNLSGEPFLTTLSDLSEEIKQSVDFAIDEGEINGRPSTLVNLSSREAVVIKR